MTSWRECTRVGFQVCIWNPTSPLISSFEIPLKAFESFSPSTKPGHRTGVWLLCVFWVWLVRSGHECVERKKWQPGAPLFFHRNMSFTTNVWVSLLLHIQPYTHWQMDRQARACAHPYWRSHTMMMMMMIIQRLWNVWLSVHQSCTLSLLPACINFVSPYGNFLQSPAPSCLAARCALSQADMFVRLWIVSE